MHEGTRAPHRNSMNWMRKPLTGLACLLLLAGATVAQAPSVGDDIIQQVLEPLKTGLETQNIQLILSVFDKQELSSYSQLQGQLRAFYQQFDQINFRYQLLQVSNQGDRAAAAVDVQMDALPYNTSQVPVRRSVQMRLQLKHGPKEWKITGFAPSDFFSVEYKGGN
jgi:hypothetical protein